MTVSRFFQNIFVISLIIVMVMAAPVSAQRIVADVTVNTDKMPPENQSKLSGLDRILEAYINQREWGPNDYKYDIPFDFSINFDQALPVEFEDRYKAAVTISNRGNYVHSDRFWQFAHEPGVPLVFDQQFDSFRSLIDFYTLMVLGYEFDKVEKFGGRDYFEQARQIAQQARLSSRYYLGWEKREEWVDEILDPLNDNMRYLNFLYYTGEWLYYTERDRETAKQYLLYAIKQLDKIRDDNQLRRFYELNFHDYGTMLSEYEEWSSLSKLASVDPVPEHSDFYEQLLDKR
ncbi:MAG TPA: DUF4835 family protein [Bacteroidetes bacterium]|nr:hypothetical protein BMS3Bbin04_01556 [bacterium BMS3Bbin04]HDO66313.1 DUF4835 family protein [Bacteroidota bacterium]HEX05438.1 DUF4835 family protein [Bacteroidota bacterium]